MTGFPELSRWVEQHLGSSGASGPAYAALALGGLLASLLPCVYPLYPITAALVRNRGGEGVRWRHPAIYYAGLVSTYGVLGVTAGLFGGAFNAALRFAATNLIIGLVLVLLAAATAGRLRAMPREP